jgi:RNA-binding protein
MSDELRKQAHELDVTVWVGKKGIDAVVDELDDQLNTEELAAALAERVDAEVIDTRGHTAVFH